MLKVKTMKAKLIETGEELEVYSRNYVTLDGKRLFRAEQLDFNVEKDRIDNREWYCESFPSREQCCEFLNKHGFKSEDFHFSHSGVGTPYVIFIFQIKNYIDFHE